MTRRIIYSLAVILGMAFSGCINSDDELCPGDNTTVTEPTPVDVNLTFVISQGNGQLSRAPGHDDYGATEAESLVDFANNDYRVLVFDNGGRLLQILDTEVVRNFNYPDGVTTCLVRGKFDNAYPEFQIAVLANWESFGLDYNNMLRGVSLLDDLVSHNRTIPYTFPVRGTGWRPFSGTNRGIPMFGLQSYTVDWNKAPINADNSVTLNGNVSLLRAVAKIEVVDRITPNATTTRAEIESVTLRGYNVTGCPMPDMKANPGWNIQNTQVVLPTIPTPDNYMQNGDLTLFRDDDVAIDGVTYPRFSTYVSEFSLNSQLADAQFCPTLHITVKNPPIEDPHDEMVTYTIKLASYTDGVAGSPLPSLLRNHIYRYEVNSASANILKLEYTVCPWEEVRVTLPSIPE